MIRKKDVVSERNEENKELKQYEWIQNRENKNEDEFGMGWFSKKATSDNELFVDSLNLHEIRNEILGDYTGDFEIIGDTIIGEHKQTTAMRFKNIEHYEPYINNIAWIIMLMILYLLVIFII